MVAVVVGLPLIGTPAADAQGSPLVGSGAHFYLAGAGNTSGVASQDFLFGDPRDEVYFGDFIDAYGVFGGDGRDDAMVRRGNTFTIRGQGGRTFTYGDPGDTVLVGDWDGDGTDTLAVRRGNVFFVKNDVDTGIADYTFVYGNPADTVLVGNWDGDSSTADAAYALTTDTIMIRRGNHYFVKNSTTTGIADYDFWFGDPGDTVLVGDWATAPVYGDDPATPGRETRHVVAPGESGDYADALAVRRGKVYFQSDEVHDAEALHTGYRLGTYTSFAYGDPGDSAFSAQLDYTYDLNGSPDTLYGDGLGVRRNDVPLAAPGPSGSAQPAPAGAASTVRTYVAVGDSITAGMAPWTDSLSVPGPTSWLNGETATRLVRVGGWAVPGTSTEEMRANVVSTPADVLVLLAGTNDLARGVPWAATEANLRAISATSGARRTLLVAIPPSNTDPGAHAAFNARLSGLASREGWRFVAPWTSVAANGTWVDGSSVDGIHPTAQTAVAIGQVISTTAWQVAAHRTGR